MNRTLATACLLLLAACASPGRGPAVVIEPRFHAMRGDRVGIVPRAGVRNANGSARVAPALGYAQLTASADADLREMSTAPAFAWMTPEVRVWPRTSAVHDTGVTKATLDSLLRTGRLTSRDEYLFDPVYSLRAAAFWLRLLENKWTSDTWPGGYGTHARQALNGGAPLTESQLVDLVTVSYNRGYVSVHDLVARHGPSWTSHLDELGAAGTEAADYLERVRAYTALLETAARR